MSTPPPLFAVIGDVHGRMGLLRTVLRRIAREKVQGILLVGDLSCARNAPRGSGRGARYLEVVGEVLAAVRAVARPVFFVPGNHDWPDLELPGNLDCRAITIGGVSLAGLGGAGPARFGFPYEWSENDAAMRLPQKADILVSHTPPFNTPLDLTYTKVQAGSAAVRTWALERGRVLVCGHIHEGAGVFRLGDCLCLNAGGLGEPSPRAQVGFVRGTDEIWHEDLEAGTVSRLTRSPAG